jgi:hypothetical protein
MTHPIYRVSSLGRPLDPRYKSNRLAILGSAAAGLLILWFNFFASTPLDTSAVTAAIGVFLAWAIGRELDPDRPRVAALAMAISLPAIFLGPPALMLGFGTLVATRAISGTVGAPLQRVDLLALVGMAGLLGAGGITSVALPGLLVAAVLSERNRRGPIPLVAGMVVAAGVGAAVARPSLVWEAATGTEFVLLGLTIGAAFSQAPAAIASLADLGGRMSSHRIRVSRWVAAGTVALGFILGGGPGVVAAFPTAGAAVLAAGVVGLAGRSHPAPPAPVERERVT